MRVRAVTLILASVIKLNWIAVVNAAPPPESVQAGEIEIEDTKEKQRNPRQIAEEQLGTWLVEMRRYTANGGVGDVTPIGDEGTSYLSVLYLYCINKFGPCPYILDALLESDVRDSRAKGEARCPTMSKFWKTWLASDSENRSRYLLSIGAGTAIADFNVRERPRYLQCKPTVAAILADPNSGKTRWGAEGTVTTAVTKTTRLFEEIKAKQIDIHSSVGLSN
jgi:hypothetical protein